MAEVDKKEKTKVEPILNLKLEPNEIEILKLETYAAVAIDGTIKQGFNVKDYYIKYNKQTQLCTVVGSRTTILIPITNIAFMQI